MSEKYICDIVLTKLFTTCGTFSVPIAKVFIDALFAKQVKTSSDRHTLKAVFAHRTSQHPQRHLQHVCISPTIAATCTTTAGSIRVASVLFGGLVFGRFPLSIQPAIYPSHAHKILKQMNYKYYINLAFLSVSH